MYPSFNKEASTKITELILYVLFGNTREHTHRII